MSDILEALSRGAAEPGRVFIHPAEAPVSAASLAADANASGPVTYAQARARAGQYASALADLGVAKGDRVAMQVTKSVEAICLYLGCLRLGAVFLPLNPAYTPAETTYFLTDAETALYVCDPDMRAATADHVPFGAMIGLTGQPGRDLASLADTMAGDFTDPPHMATELAAILYTSGTTGRSKGVMLTRGNLASNAETLAKVWAFTDRDALLHALPIFHTHGLFVATNTVLMAGASMTFLPDFRPDTVLAALPRSSVMMGVPTYYTRLLADPGLTRDAVAHMRLFISGSAPLSVATHRDWQHRTGHAILERYGMTETNMNTSNPYRGDRRAGTVGLPLPGVEVRVTDPKTGQPLPQGMVGGVEVRGPNVFTGYWRQPDKTAADIRPDGFFITGDMGTFDADGYLRIVGRARDLVISGGMNVYPAEVEDVLDDMPGVAASAVIGVPHPDLGEAVVAIVIPRPDAALTETALRDAMRTWLAAYKLPKRIMFVTDLPHNAMGKVQKNQLRKAWASLFES